MVVQRSMLNWRRGWGQSAIGIWALCYIYMKHIWCNGFPEIYAQLEEGLGSICHGDMCIVLYLLDLPSLVQQYSRHLCLIDWGCQSTMHICALCYICWICQVWCSGIQDIYAQLTGVGGHYAMGMYALCYM